MEQLSLLRGAGLEICPIMSENAYSTDTRFMSADAAAGKIRDICGRDIIRTIADAEPLGAIRRLDELIIAPCTGNTLAKLAQGITDTAVTMAAKAHLRSDGRLLIALASNDATSANLANIATLLNRKGVYFVPLKQDAPRAKPHSLAADFQRIPECLEKMREGIQVRPLFV
jgi:dipicolinate synthase subunit B